MLKLVLQTEAKSCQVVAGWGIEKLQNLGCAQDREDNASKL